MRFRSYVHCPNTARNSYASLELSLIHTRKDLSKAEEPVLRREVEINLLLSLWNLVSVLIMINCSIN